MLIPNPFYAAYAAGALAADCEPVYLPATRATGFLPDLDALDEALLARTVAFYIASPSNPQGAVADRDYLDAAARRWRAASASSSSPTNAIARSTASDTPAGMLEASRPGLRQRHRLPFAVEALEPARPARRLRRRRPAFPRRAFSSCAMSPRRKCRGRPQHVAIAAYDDEAHVEENRELYNAKFDLADQIIGDRYGYKRPAGGFFLWLDVSAHSAAAKS